VVKTENRSLSSLQIRVFFRKRTPAQRPRVIKISGGRKHDHASVMALCPNLEQHSGAVAAWASLVKRRRGNKKKTKKGNAERTFISLPFNTPPSIRKKGRWSSKEDKRRHRTHGSHHPETSYFSCYEVADNNAAFTNDKPSQTWAASLLAACAR